MSLRIIAFALVIICGTLAVTSGLAACFTYEMGLYTQPLDKVIRNKQQIAQEIAAMQIFEHRKKIEKDNWVLKDSNIEYGIIQAKNNPENQDLNDKKIYLDYRFEDTAPDSNSYISTPFYNNDSVEYTNRLFPSLTGTGMYRYTEPENTTTGLAPVTQICYNTDNEAFYFSTAEHSYPVTIIGIDAESAVLKPDMYAEKEYYPEEHYTDMGNENNLVYFRLTPDEKQYVSISGNYENLDTRHYRAWKILSFYTYIVDAIAIPKVKSNDLLPRNNDTIDISLIASEEIEMYEEILGGYDDFEEIPAGSHKMGTAQYTKQNNKKSDNAYWIVSKVKPMNKWSTKNDLIAKQHFLLTKLHNYRYLAILLTVVMTIIALLAAIFCIWSAGYRQAQEKDEREFCSNRPDVILTWWQKIPLEIFLIAGGILFMAIIACAESGLGYLFLGSIYSWLAFAFIEFSFVLAIGCVLTILMNLSHLVHGKILSK